MSQQSDSRSKPNRPHVDQSALNFGSQSAATTDASSTRTLSSYNPSHQRLAAVRTVGKQGKNESENENENDDKRSVVSAYSYRSDIDAYRFLRQVEGRAFNALNETYFLPADEPEWVRLNKQHLAFVLAFGGLYPARETVDAILAPQDGVKKRILDLGTGTGIWAIDMAKKFPHAEVLGVDVAPVPVDPAAPSNCQFEIDDIQLRLTHFHNPADQFDLIHARLIVLGLKDFRRALTDVQKCLKPGGLLIWVEPDHEWFTPDIHVYRILASDGVPTGSWTGRFAYEAMRAGSNVGRCDFAGMVQVLDRGLWEEPLFDPETCRTASVYLPIGPWASHEDVTLSQRLKYIGALMRQDLREIRAGFRAILVKAGWQADTLTEWESKAEEEISGLRSPAQLRFRMAWGRRRAAPDQLAPPLPVFPPVSQTQTQTSSSMVGNADLKADLLSSSLPYPLFYVYDTQEQALAEDALRKRSKEGFVPLPLP